MRLSNAILIPIFTSLFKRIAANPLQNSRLEVKSPNELHKRDLGQYGLSPTFYKWLFKC